MVLFGNLFQKIGGVGKNLLDSRMGQIIKHQIEKKPELFERITKDVGNQIVEGFNKNK